MVLTVRVVDFRWRVAIFETPALILIVALGACVLTGGGTCRRRAAQRVRTDLGHSAK